MMHRSARTFLSAIALVMALPALAADTYTIDAVHSTVGFKIKHLSVSNVTGRFAKFDGAIHLDSADLTKSTVSVSIPVDSVDTGNETRDGQVSRDHLHQHGRLGHQGPADGHRKLHDARRHQVGGHQR